MPGSAEEAHAAWSELLATGRYDDLLALCERWLPKDALKLEGYKCLSRATIARAEQLAARSDDTARRASSGRTSPRAAQRAVGYLAEAIALAPLDLSLHERRLLVLMDSGNFEGTAAALRDTLEKSPSADAIDTWLAYSERFMEARQYRAATAFLRVLEEKYPEDHRIVANLGAFYGLLEDSAQALAYAKRAVQLHPSDARSLWNLGRMHDYAGNVQEADKHFQGSLALRDDAIYQDSQCLYARFLRDRRGDKPKACRVWTEHCPQELPAGCRAEP